MEKSTNNVPTSLLGAWYGSLLLVVLLLEESSLTSGWPLDALV